MHRQFCHPSNASIEVNTSIKALGLKRQFQYPVQVKGQGMAQTLHGLHFYQSSGGRKTHKRSHAESLYHAVPELSAFGKPVNTVVLALVGMETQVHTRKTLTVHKTQRRRGSDGRMSFLFLFKTLRGTAGSKKSRTATKNKRATTFIHCLLGQFEKNLTPQQLSTNLH